MTAEHDALHRLTKAIEEATQVGHCIWETLEELRTDLIHEIRNRVDGVMSGPRESEPQVVSCAGHCDASVDSLAEAVKTGWSRLTHDPEGLSWSFIGICPTCAKEDAAEESPPRPKTPGSLFPIEE